MKIHLIKKQSIAEYTLRNARSCPSFEEWWNKLRYADWEQPADIMQTFRAADLSGKSSCRVVFDIGGNAYRMICKYGFGTTEVHLFICRIGTHAEYDQLNAQNRQYTICNY